MRALWAIVLIIACGKSDREAPKQASPARSSTDSAPSAAVEEVPQPTAVDATAQTILAAGTKCERSGLGLPIDCPEYKRIGEHAFQNQGSEATAATCAKFLTDTDAKKRLLASNCLDHLNAVTATTQLGAALDAIEKEQDEIVREQIAWGIKNAEAVTAKLDARVIAVVNKLAADQKAEKAAGYLFDTLFPQYMMGPGPKPPPAAQALALEALTRDGTGMQRTALNSVRLLDDTAAVCAALGTAIRADATMWHEAASALADVGAPCAADVPRVIDLTLERLKAGDARMNVLVKLDRKLELDAATRKRIAKTLKSARGKAREWERKGIDETAARFAKPREEATE
jgi:hypothetical protein